jgi:hypothetical protein
MRPQRTPRVRLNPVTRIVLVKAGVSMLWLSIQLRQGLRSRRVANLSWSKIQFKYFGTKGHCKDIVCGERPFLGHRVLAAVSSGAGAPFQTSVCSAR